MEYKFTFEDGSEVLAHHGVKGMKWGVRNAETLAKYGLSGVGKSVEGGGGGGGIVIEDEDDTEELDAEDWGYKENTPEMREHVYGEFGLSSDMSREEAIAKLTEEHRQWVKEHPPKTPAAAINQFLSYSQDMSLAKTLPKTRIDARKYGMSDNSGASQEAAYNEAGLSRNMTRSEAQKIVRERHANQPKATTQQALVNQAVSYAKDMELANSLPKTKSKKKATPKFSG